jgi:hypothetical protein
MIHHRFFAGAFIAGGKAAEADEEEQDANDVNEMVSDG